MDAPEVHAYACGYRGARGTRTWIELMGVLEKAGFIRAKSGNGRRYDTVLIVHPVVVVKRLASVDTSKPATTWTVKTGHHEDRGRDWLVFTA
jgi:hypothetical protein